MAGRRIGAVAAVLGALLCTPAAGSAQARPQSQLGKEPFTVIAVVDSGIDPYHHDFRRPRLTAHPSTFIEGYPRDAAAVELSLDESDYGAALRADKKTWAGVKANRLYWIPGTNIVGAIGPFDAWAPIGPEDEILPAPEDRSFFDSIGHGTAVASLAGGAIHGPASDRTLIVAVNGYEDALAWAARQPWIDVITNSWWNLESEDYAEGAKASRLAVENGKVVCFASGNFSHPQLWTGTQGPSWTVNVGAASAKTRGEHYYTDYPNDVLGLSGVPAAQAGSLDNELDFAGTSAAAPNVCGLFAKTISEVSAHLGDGVQGPRKGALAIGAKGKGYLADGRVTRAELEDALQATAVPAEANVDPSDANAIPASPVAPFVRGGYGIVDERSAARALGVLLGLRPRPDRALEDAWIASTDAARDAIWGQLAP